MKYAAICRQVLAWFTNSVLIWACRGTFDQLSEPQQRLGKHQNAIEQALISAFLFLCLLTRFTHNSPVSLKGIFHIVHYGWSCRVSGCEAPHPHPGPIKSLCKRRIWTQARFQWCVCRVNRKNAFSPTVTEERTQALFAPTSPFPKWKEEFFNWRTSSLRSQKKLANNTNLPIKFPDEISTYFFKQTDKKCEEGTWQA